MRGIPHLVIGASCGLALAGSGYQAHPEIIAAAAVASLLPDLDGEYSTAGSVPIVGGIASASVRLAAKAIGVVRPVKNPFSDEGMIHRGPFHTPFLVGVMAATLLGFGVDQTLVLAFAVGYLSHLLADGATKMGIAWLWPIYQSMIRMPISWRSGNALIEMPLSLMLLALVVYYVH